MRLLQLTSLVPIVAFVCSLQVVACSSDPAAVSAGGGSGGVAAGTVGASAGGGAAPSNSDAVVGSFIVALVPKTSTDPGYTSLTGKVYDGVTPATVVWDLVTSAAGCDLMKPRAPFCSTPCASGGVCVEDEQCAAYPTAQDLGAVTVKGLGADFSVKAIANAYQLPGDLTLPFPPADEGADVSVNVTAGAFGPFAIRSSMVAPLAASGALSLESGKALKLGWASPGNASAARMHIKVDISHHGGSKGKIECDVADSGSFEVPAALVGSLVSLGVAGFPSVELSRVATGSAAIAPGKVTFQVLSTVSLDLAVPGVQSCHEDTECPTGKPCKQDLTCTP